MRIKRKYLCAALAIIVALLLVGAWTVMRITSKLNRARILLESDYRASFELIEKHAHEKTLDRPTNMADVMRPFAIREEIAQSLPPEAVYWANWSDDGHHGLERIDQTDDRKGYTTYYWPVVRDETGLRSCMLGRSEEGQSLVVYDVWLPDAQKRNYRIAFFESAILERMAKTQK